MEHRPNPAYSRPSPCAHIPASVLQPDLAESALHGAVREALFRQRMSSAMYTAPAAYRAICLQAARLDRHIGLADALTAPLTTCQGVLLLDDMSGFLGHVFSSGKPLDNAVTEHASNQYPLSC